MKTTTIDALYTAVINKVKTLSIFANVYDELNTRSLRDKVCVVELESVDFSDGGQIHDGIDKVSVSFSVLVFCPLNKGRKPAREVRDLAVRVARLFSGEMIEGGNASPVQTMEDSSFDDVLSHAVWEVQIEISDLYLGELPEETNAPTEIMAAWVPDVGPDHIDSYEPLENGTQI